MRRKRFKIKNRLRFAIIAVLFVLVIGVGGGALALYLGGEDATPRLEKGLVGHWKLDGTFEDATPNSNDGVVDGGSPGIVADRKGQGTGAYTFSGTDHVDIADDDIFSFTDGADTDSAFSVSAWVNADDFDDKGILSKYDSIVTTNKEWVFFFDTSSHLNIEVHDDSNGGRQGRLYNTVLTTNQWYHVVGTYDGSESSAGMNLYVDGVVVDDTDDNTGSYTGMENKSAPVMMGYLQAGSDPNLRFDGELDDIRLYNRVLTAAEVTALYDSYDPGVTTGDLQKDLKGYWKFNGDAEDRTPYSNDGTVTDASLATDRKSQSNKAYDFNSSNNRIIVSDNSAIQDIWDGGGTISLWVNADDGGENNEGTFVAKTDGSVKGWRFYLADLSGSTIGVKLNTRFDVAQCSSINATWNTNDRVITFGQWYHIVVTYNNDSVSNDPLMYIDGQSVTVNEGCSPTSGTRKSDGGEDLYFGTQNGLNRDFDGKMDDIRMYDRVLTAAEVASLYDSYNPGIVMNRGVMDVLGSTGSIIPMINSEFDDDSATFETRGEASAKTFTWSEDPKDFDTAPSKVNGNDVVTFNGTDEQADALDAAYWTRALTAFSVGAWINPTIVNSRTVISKRTAVGDNREWILGFDNVDSKLHLALFDDDVPAAELLAEADTVLTINTWYFVAATYDGTANATGITIYVDGSAPAQSTEDNASFVSMRDGTSKVEIAAQNNEQSWFFAGSMAAGEIGPFFVQKELTAAEVTELYNYGKRKLGL